MAVFDGSDLKEWRKARKISAAELASRISVDESTIFRYESGKQVPDPDTMYQICKELGDIRNWDAWMRTEFSSYGRFHPEPIRYDLPGSILSLYAVCDQIEKYWKKVFQDAADGSIDNEETRAKLLQLMNDMVSAGQAVRALLPPIDKESGWR